MPQVMSFESSLVGAEDYKFINEKKINISVCGVRIEVSEFTRESTSHLCLNLMAQGYISDYYHNTLKSQTDLLQVWTSKTNV